MIGISKKLVSVALAFIIAASAAFACESAFAVKAEAASWNGTNYGGGAYGYLDEPGVEALNCTGFVWHVLYKSAVLSGASKSQIDSLPVMGDVIPTWHRLGVYCVYFKTKEEALASGILEKGDLLWMYGTKDCHNAIFYGNSSSHDRYWHSAGPNSFGRIDAPGDFLGMWVAKVTQPDNIELHINANGSNTGSESFGAKYSIFSTKSEATAARDNPSDMTAWDKRIGTIVLGDNGKGCLRKADAPPKTELWSKGVARTQHSYFDSEARKVSAKNTYYAVQWSPGYGMGDDDGIYELTDSGRRTPSGYKIFSAKISKRTVTPDFSEIKSTENGVKLSWDEVKGADKYRVYYKNRRGEWTRMTETDSTSFTDTDVKLGNTYTYTIRCVDKNGAFISDFISSGRKHTYTGIPAPEFTEISGESEGIRLKWNEIPGAAKYRLYYINKNGEWARLCETAKTEFLDDEVSAGKTYTYTIRCLNKNGVLVSGYEKDGRKYTFDGIDVPEFTGMKSENEGIRLSWNEIPGAAKYRLYYINKNGEWARLGETSSTEFLDKEVIAGKTYTYTIRCLNQKGYTNSGFDSDGSKVAFEGIGTPKISYIGSESEGIRLSWQAVPGAAKYRVYIMGDDGEWRRIGDTYSTGLLCDKLNVGKTYKFTVRCLNSAGYTNSGYNSDGWSCRYEGVGTPHITRLESTKSGVKISWDKVDGARLYRVFYLGRTGWKRLGDTTSLSMLDTDVSIGGNYTYTVRCVGESGSYISRYDDIGSKIKYSR
ncbi:MAG: hypothetical protein IIZ36_04925 [Ruminococcus sp.]|nr:hypothetical protein [Ruminococcus sp.]